MIARYAGASLGLLAFSVSILAGLFVQNPVSVTLSRSIIALFVFCVIGLVLGSAAQVVVAEHEKNRKSEIQKRFRVEPADTDAGGGENTSTGDDAGPIPTEGFPRPAGSVREPNRPPQT